MEKFLSWINIELNILTAVNTLDKQRLLFLRQYFDSYGYYALINHPIPPQSQERLKLRYKMLKSRDNISECVEWFSGLVECVKKEHSWQETVKLSYGV